MAYGYGAGRAFQSAGGDIGAIARMLLSLDAQNRARSDQAARDAELKPTRDLQRAVAGAQAARAGVFQGDMPTVMNTPSATPPLETPGPAQMPSATGAPVGTPMPGGKTPEIGSRALADWKPTYSPSPDYQNVPGAPGYYMRTPETQAQYDARVATEAEAPQVRQMRNWVGALAASNGQLDTPEAQDAAANIAARGGPLSTIRAGVSPQPPVPGTREWEGYYRKQQGILAEFRAKQGKTDLSTQALIGLRGLVQNTSGQLAALAKYDWKDPKAYQDAKNNILSANGWDNEAEFTKAASFVKQAGQKAIGGYIDAPQTTLPGSTIPTGRVTAQTRATQLMSEHPGWAEDQIVAQLRKEGLIVGN